MNESRFDLEELDAILREAFPSAAALDRVLFLKLGWSLYDLAGEGPGRTVVLRLLQHTRATHTTGLLVEACHAANDTHRKLESYYQRYFALDEAEPANLERITRQNAAFQSFEETVRRQAEILECVCRVDIDGEAEGTGFLVGPSAVLTNFHVIADRRGKASRPSSISCHFGFTRAGAGKTYGLTEGGILGTSPWSASDLEDDPDTEPSHDELDFALLELEEPVGAKNGWLKLTGDEVPLRPRTPMFIVQHPAGKPLKVALDSEAILRVNDNRTRLRYRTNTLPGSSGSPCFDARWRLIALHHAGDPRPYRKRDPFGKSNEGIPIDSVYKALERMNLTLHLAGRRDLRDTALPELRHAEKIDREDDLAKPTSGGPAQQEISPPVKRAARGPFKLIYHCAPDDSSFGEALEKQLAGLVTAGLVERPWSEADIRPGRRRDHEIHSRWNEADFILLVVSASFLAEGDKYLQMAKRRHDEGAVVVPIIARSCLWQISWLGTLQAYPIASRAVKPVSQWSQQDQAWLNVIEALQGMAEERRGGTSGLGSRG